MHISFVPTLALAGAALCSLHAHAAEPVAPTGAKGTLSVDYVFEAAGKKQDKLDLREWRVLRTVSVVVDVAAQAVSGWPQLHAPDATSVAANAQRGQRAAAVAQAAAPMMASVEKIIARCGDDEACISRETQKLGFGLAGTPELAAAQQAGAGAQALSQPDAPRYQAWLSTAERGSYAIDEATHIVHADPICMSLPKARCTRDEVRQGKGAVPAAGARPGAAGGLGAVELDVRKNTFTVRLPILAAALPYSETVTTDEPEGTHSVPTPRGPQPRQRVFMPRAGAADLLPPITVALRGSSRSQSGEQVWPVATEGETPGKLTVRWRFVAR